MATHRASLSRKRSSSGEELAHRQDEPPRAARTAPLPPELDPRVATAIGVDELYVHQRQAWDAAARGEHLLVTTGTASGKTLAFNLPVLDASSATPRTGCSTSIRPRRSPRTSSAR